VCGKTSCTFHGGKPKTISAFWKDITNLYPTCENFVWPDRSVESEKRSFKLQCDKFVHSDRPDVTGLIEKVNAKYIRHTIPEYLLKYDRRKWNHQIEDIKTQLKPEASPGVPYALVALRNDQLMEKLGMELNEIVLDRIELRLTTPIEEVKRMSKMERIRRGFLDPVRVFVKDEPHKKAKAIEGRHRLIMSVSIVDKIIEMLLSRHLHKLEIANWMDIPSKPGIGFTDEMNEAVYNQVMAMGNMAYADISGWDWSCKQWLLDLCGQGKIALCNNPSPDWEHLVMMEPVLEGSSVYQFSDGTLVAPSYEGIVNSGKYKTSRDNSWMRVALATLLGAEHVLAAGDDTVESYVENVEHKYRALGWGLKDYQRVENGFEFCSRWYSANGSYPLNVEKALMNLLHADIRNWISLEMHLLQFIDQTFHHPDFGLVMRHLETIGFSTQSWEEELN